jgi:calcium permeable stress-gated cation channel
VKTVIDKKKCTRRELRTGVFSDYQMEYGWIYPNLLMVLMILTTYMCIAPLLLPCGVAYFAFAYCMYKYQLLYVFVNEYQSGGKMWYQVFNRSMIILVCGSLVLLGYLGLKKAFYSGPFYLMFPQPFLLLYFWKYCNDKFMVPSFVSYLHHSIS